MSLDITARGLAAQVGAQIAAGSLLPNCYGRLPGNLTRTRAMIARVRAGKGRGRILCIGDSKRAGAGAGASNSGTQYYATGAAPFAMPDQLAAALAGIGVPASRQSWAGSKSLATTALIAAYDSRLTIGASWSGGVSSLGGVGLASAGTDSLTFAPAGAVDTAIIVSKQHGGDGTLNVLVDGATSAAATIVGNGTDGFKVTSVALGAAGPHTVAVARVSGGYGTVFGMLCINSAVPAIDVVNCGAIGSLSAFHTSATSGTWAAQAAIAAWTPDLVAIQLGTNDLNQSVPLATTLANIQALVAAAQAANADVILEYPTYAVSGYGTASTREALRQGLIQLGAATGCMVLDHATRFGTEAQAASLGFMSPDGIHESAIGYADQVGAFLQAVLI